jgi:hypothetical protein
MAYYCISFRVVDSLGKTENGTWSPIRVFFNEEDAKKCCWNYLKNKTDHYEEFYECPHPLKGYAYLKDLQFCILPKKETIKERNTYYSNMGIGYFYCASTLDTQSFVVLSEYDHKETGVSQTMIEYEPNKEVLDQLAILIEEHSETFICRGDESVFTMAVDFEDRVSLFTAFEMTRVRPFGYSYYGSVLYTGKGNWEPLRRYLYYKLYDDAKESWKHAEPKLEEMNIPEELIQIIKKEVLENTWNDENSRDDFMQTVFYKDGMENFFGRPEDANKRIRWLNE